MTLTEVIHDLIDSGFFEQTRTFKEIKNEVELEVGFVQHTTLYPVIINMVAKGFLSRRRNRSERWEYVRIKGFANVGEGVA